MGFSLVININIRIDNIKKIVQKINKEILETFLSLIFDKVEGYKCP